jgi:hypothetical protein
MPCASNTIPECPTRDVIPNGSYTADNLMTRDDGTANTSIISIIHKGRKKGNIQPPTHNIILRKHIREAYAACFDLHKNLIWTGRRERRFLDDKRGTGGFEDGLFVSLRDGHFVVAYRISLCRWEWMRCLIECSDYSRDLFIYSPLRTQQSVKRGRYFCSGVIMP